MIQKQPTADRPRPPLLISIAESARLLSLSRRSIERLIASGELASRRLRSRRLVLRESLENLASTDDRF